MSEQDEKIYHESIEALDIAALRRAAKTLGITAARDWNKEDFVSAIKRKQSVDATTRVVFDSSRDPAPGYARVLLHRDPTPNHANSPVPIGLNGQIYMVPRGVEVDVPKEFVGVLNDAKTLQVRQQEQESRINPGGVYKEELQTSYPFQVLSITPGQWKNKQDNRSAAFAIRKEFMEMHGSWPTEGELKAYKNARMANRMAKEV